ncbi:MAG: NrpR regulatory domain-containing protein [Methanocellales archaeon]|nr:NrpR regulatory domain-containing protein [Methanocellales archaeon]
MPNEQKLLDILSILHDSKEPLGATVIARRLESMGYDIGERMVRNYLQILDKKRFTKKVGRKGRVITAEGVTELKAERVHERLGFVKAVIQDLTYQVTYDPIIHDGDIVVNCTWLNADDVKKALSTLKLVYEKGWMISPLVKVLLEGDELEGNVIPTGKAALLTVCSMSIDGILVNAGIPTDPIYGGIVEVRSNTPERFVEIIRFDGSSLDPLELFLAKGMTSILKVVETGRGKVLANYREIPASSRDEAMRLLDDISEHFGGILMVGEPEEKVLGLSASQRKCGIAMLGGLNPIAAMEEAGVSTRTEAIHGLMPIKTMKHIEEVVRSISQPF